MMDVNDAWERFLVAEYIIYWMGYYLNRILQRIHEDE
jgi:hypothetical protein